jgi:histidine triad (HIT) family protein
MPERVPMDLTAYERRRLTGVCYICAFLVGDPDNAHETVYEDDAHVAYLSRYPTMIGYVLVAPKAHIEHVVRDLAEPEYLRLMAVVRRVALGVESVVGPERTYLLSLGSQQGNSHLHWHIAPLPVGVPYHQQQCHALMVENGVLNVTPAEIADVAQRIRVAIPG